MMATFVCSFMNPDTGERCEVIVGLDEHDEAAIEYHRACDGDNHANFIAQACALRQAYQEVPKGFLHDRPPERMYLQ